MMVSRLFFITIFSVLLNAKDVGYNPEQARNLILRNSFNNLERIIYINDMILIDVAGDSRHYAGTLLSIQDNFIFINKKSILGNSIIAIDVNEIDAIYLGIGKTVQQLRNRWGLGFAIVLIPGSINMAYNAPLAEGVPKSVGAIATWGMFSSIGYLFYGNIFGGIDYAIRKGRAQEFIIEHNGWFIDNNY